MLPITFPPHGLCAGSARASRLPRRGWGLLVCLVALLPTLAPAAKKPPTSEAARQEAAALVHYQAGMVHYNVGDFDLAIDEFKLAYEISSAPALLFNIAQAYRLKKDHDPAIHAYRSFLRLQPNAPNRGDVEALIRECERASAAQIIAPTPPATPPVKPPVERGGIAPRPAPIQTVLSGAHPATPTPPPPSRSLLVAGGATTGLGGALLVAAAVCGGLAQSAAGQISTLVEQRGSWSPRYQTLYEGGQRYAIASNALLVAGAVAVVSGVTLLIVGRARAVRAGLPSGVSSDGGMIEAAWRF